MDVQTAAEYMNRGFFGHGQAWRLAPFCLGPGVSTAWIRASPKASRSSDIFTAWSNELVTLAAATNAKRDARCMQLVGSMITCPSFKVPRFRHLVMEHTDDESLTAGRAE